MQTLFEGMVAVSTPMPADVFFDIDELGLDTSRQTGTPINSEVGDEDTDEEAMMARLEDEINDRDEIKNLMEHTDLRKVLGGQECENPVLQIFNFEKLSRAKCYRAHGQDGNIASSKISFSANINDRVEEFDNKYPILSITSYQLYNGSFLFIRDFEVLRILDNLEGTPEYLTEKDYDEMKAHLKANDNLPQTPSMVIRKLSNKNVDELNARPISTAVLVAVCNYRLDYILEATIKIHVCINLTMFLLILVFFIPCKNNTVININHKLRHLINSYYQKLRIFSRIKWCKYKHGCNCNIRY